MSSVVLCVTLVAEVLAAISVLVSMALPHRRVWPPPRQRSWAGYLMWLLFLVSGLGVVALGLIDWGGFYFALWIRWGVGIPLWCAGNVLALWAIAVLGVASTFGDEGSLVRRGPYRFSRNPQYLGFIAGLVGWALVAGSALTLVASLAGTIPLVLVPFAEEPWLTARQGAAYEEYKRTVPRFITVPCSCLICTAGYKPKGSMRMPFVVPEAGSFLLPGGPIGCLLVHGFTSMPEEMRWLGDDLAQRGYTVLGVRLAGHATHPQDLAHTRWEDWMISVEDGLALLGGITEQAFVLGLSLGGNVTLLAAAHYPIKGAVVMSTPYRILSRGSLVALRLASWLRPLVRKGVPEHPTLGERREADYPAYAEYPTRILFEVVRLQAKVREALAAVKVPVLLIHSQQDAAVPAESIQQISDHLGTSDKELVLLEGFDHALVRDPRREEVFEVIADFIGRVSGAE